MFTRALRQRRWATHGRSFRQEIVRGPCSEHRELCAFSATNDVTDSGWGRHASVASKTQGQLGGKGEPDSDARPAQYGTIALLQDARECGRLYSGKHGEFVKLPRDRVTTNVCFKYNAAASTRAIVFLDHSQHHSMATLMFHRKTAADRPRGAGNAPKAGGTRRRGHKSG